MGESVRELRSAMHEADAVVSRIVSKISREMDLLDRVMGGVEGGLANLPYAGTATESQVMMTRRTVGDAAKQGKEIIYRIKTDTLR